MILIADSGGTKTAWRVIDKGRIVNDIETKGLNPYYRTPETIINVISNELFPNISSNIAEIYFYGAGCSNIEGCNKIRDVLHKTFPEAQIEVTHDLLGVARALCENKEGIACILGTGSNSCHYDGVEIVKNIPSLGYILGDEGGGSFMGKKLVTDYLRGNMPRELADIFHQKFKLGKSEIEKKVYLEDNPMQFLSGFAPFILDHVKEQYMHDLVSSSFRIYLEYSVFKYQNYKRLPIHFVGGVAYNFREILIEVLNDEGLKIGNILNNPIEGLTQYHLSL